MPLNVLDLFLLTCGKHSKVKTDFLADHGGDFPFILFCAVNFGGKLQLV